jgi:hypothetical protein
LAGFEPKFDGSFQTSPYSWYNFKSSPNSALPHGSGMANIGSISLTSLIYRMHLRDRARAATKQLQVEIENQAPNMNSPRS